MRFGHRAGFLCMAMVALLAPLAPTSLWAAPASATNNVNGAEIRLTLDRTEIVTGEPVFLEIRVTNRSAPLKVGTLQSSFFLHEGNDIAITVQAPGELPYRYVGTEPPGIFTKEEINLDQGKSVRYGTMILFEEKSPNGYLFGKPGEYAVSVTLAHSILRDNIKTQSTLPPVRITVRAPEGDAAAAFKLIDNRESARALQSPEPNEPVLKNATTVADKYPDTPYAPLCTYFTGAVRLKAAKPDFDAAIAGFSKYLQRWPNGPQASDAIFNIALSFDAMKKPEEARGWFYYLYDTDPEYRLLRAENPLSSHYHYGLIEDGLARRWWLYERPWDFKQKPPKQ